MHNSKMWHTSSYSMAVRKIVQVSVLDVGKLRHWLKWIRE